VRTFRSALGAGLKACTTTARKGGMKTVSGFPYFEVQFTKEGDVDDAAEVSALRDYLKKPNATESEFAAMSGRSSTSCTGKFISVARPDGDAGGCQM